MEVMEGKTETPRRTASQVSALDKIIVAFAGPLFSFLLAVVFATLVWFVGRPVSEAESTTTIGYVAAGFAGRASRVEGRATRFLQSTATRSHGSAAWARTASRGASSAAKATRSQSRLNDRKTAPGDAHVLIPSPSRTTKPWMRKALREIGILPAQTPMVAKVSPDSAAEKAGLQPNDVILRDRRPARLHPGCHRRLREGSSRAHRTRSRSSGTDTTSSSPSPLRAPASRRYSLKAPRRRAGIEKGDTIIAVDGKRCPMASAITDYIEKHRRSADRLHRPGEERLRNVTITPQVPDRRD